MTQQLKGKVALITGAVGGIGSATARLFAQQGARLVVSDIDQELGVALAAEVRGHFVRCDVGDEQSWAQTMEAVEAYASRLDILVHSAGILEVGSIMDTSLEMFERVIRVNQTSTFLAMRQCVPLMTRGGGGSIVNLSSAAGLIGTPGTLAYSASKWAVRGMTKVAAVELAPNNIRVNSVHPGGVDTDMIRFIKGDPGSAASKAEPPMARLGQASEVAQIILFLASDASSYSTGSEFVCDGGLTAR